MKDTRTFKKKDQYIYIFDIGYDSLYKVGCTSDWEQRLYSLRAANPKLRMVAIANVCNKRNIEIAMHNRLRKWKVDREIFKMDDRQVGKAIWMMKNYGPIIEDNREPL